MGSYIQFQYSGKSCGGEPDLNNHKTTRQKDDYKVPTLGMSGTAWRHWSCMLYSLMVIVNLLLASQIYPRSRLGHPQNHKQSSAVIDKSTHVRDKRIDISAVNNNVQDGAEGDGECVVSDDEADTQVKDNDKKKTPSKPSEPKPNRNKRGDSGKGSSKCKCKGRGNGKKNGDGAPSPDNASGLDIMQSLAYGICLTLGASLLGELGIKFSTIHNAKYGLPDMYRMLLSMCCGNKKSATAKGQYRNSNLPGNVRLPNRSWLLNCIRTVRHDFMLTRCQKMIRRSVKRAKRHGMIRQAVNVAIDEHDIPFHAKCMNMLYAVFSKGKKGTRRFNRLATVYCIVAGQQFTLGGGGGSPRRDSRRGSCPLAGSVQAMQCQDINSHNGQGILLDRRDGNSQKGGIHTAHAGCQT